MGTRRHGHLLSSLCIAAVSLGPATAQVIERVSVSTSGTEANATCENASVSADGRFVVFGTASGNLVPGDTNNAGDVFIRDRVTGQTQRVSVSRTGDQGNDYSGAPSISADGRFVAFESKADNLVLRDTNRKRDVFVRDRHTNSTERVSLQEGGRQRTRSSGTPSISPDGWFCAFTTLVTKCIKIGRSVTVCFDENDVLVYDRRTGRTEPVNVAPTGDPGTGGSWLPSLSAGGQYVAFCSDSSNLTPDDPHGDWDVFVRDRHADGMQMVSSASKGRYSYHWMGDAQIAADGQSVVFASDSTDLVSADTNGKWDVFVYDRQTGQTERVSLSSTREQADHQSAGPAISADGRFVAFQSLASNLVPGDTNRKQDIFVHDRRTRQTARISLSSTGEQANDGCRYPAISGNGQFVVFESYATNLVPGDTNDRLDVFIAANPFTAAPTLAWLGTSGYETDGVDPDSGGAIQTRFQFRVRYANANGNAPELMYLNLRRKGSREAVREVPMVKGPGSYHSVVYRCSRKLATGRYEYRFQARDRDGWAIGEPTKWRLGPIIETPPTLGWVGTTGFEADGVDPNEGISDQTWFRFKVLYMDADGHAPKYVTLSIRRSGEPSPFRTAAMIEGVGTYATGIAYRRRVRLPAGTYEYRFHSRDQNGFATGPATHWAAGPVLNAAPQVSIASLAVAPTPMGTQITFSLSSAAQVQARILNIAARPVKTLCHAKDCEAGTNTLVWNAQSDQGLQVPNGTYLVEVTAKGADGAQARALAQTKLDR